MSCLAVVNLLKILSIIDTLDNFDNTYTFIQLFLKVEIIIISIELFKNV